MMRAGWLTATAVGVLALGGSCTTTPPDAGEMFTRVQVFPAATGPEVTGVRRAEQVLVDEIASAEEQVDLALATFHSEAVVEALVAARDRGVAVRVVGDVDSADEPGFRQVAAADIPLRLGDGPILWSPTPTVQIERPGSTNRMTHSFVVVDRLRMVVLTRGLPDSEELSTQTVLRVESEDLGKDYGDSFDQLFGGTFATSLTAFGALTSANTNNRTRYVVDQPWVLETYYGPSQPLVKQFIDQTYAAGASVYIATPLLANDELASALRYKAEAGFEVRLLVEEGSLDSDLSVTGRLETVFAQVRERNGTDFPSISFVPHVAETFGIIDAAPSPLTGEVYERMAIWMSHELLPALPYRITEQGVEPLPAGLFSDGNLWLIREQPAHVAAPINEALARFSRLLEAP